MKLANSKMLVLKTKLHLPNENNPFFVVVREKLDELSPE